MRGAAQQGSLGAPNQGVSAKGRVDFGAGGLTNLWGAPVGETDCRFAIQQAWRVVVTAVGP